MANIKSEQIREDFSIDIEYDQPMKISEIIKTVKRILGKQHCKIIKVNNKKVLVYNNNDKKEYLLLASITYMGGNGQHPIFKKRMQLKKWYKDVVDLTSRDSSINVRFIGAYHYEGNIVFVDFVKDTYIKKKMNSSAAHVYTNDFYQAMKSGVFKRIDRNKNEIISIKQNEFKNYLDGVLKSDDKLISIIKKFNENFEFGTWLTAKEVIPEMYQNDWPSWKEVEWAGLYLEYCIDKFIFDYNLLDDVVYTGSSNKKFGDLDFDLYLPQYNFYCDLKSSDIKNNYAPGNDQETFINCINKYNRFWYIIYEHETIKDKELDDFPATRFRTNFIKSNGEWDKNKVWNELSYHSRMKHSVKFVKMSVIELNKVNYREVLDDFHQGRQPTGEARKAKFNITKRNIENFIIYQYGFHEKK